MTSLVQRITAIAVALVAAVIVAVVLVSAERSLGSAEAKVKVEHAASVAAIKAAADSGALFREAVLRADSAEARFLHSGGGQRAATGRTDTARAKLEAERDSAIRVASDSAATAAEARAELARFVAKSDSEVSAALAERDSLEQAIALAKDAIAEKNVAILSAEHATQAADLATATVQRELDAVKKAQPGVIARAAHGVVSFGVGALCAGGVYALVVTPAGPVIAVLGGAVGGGICSAVAGARR